MSALLHHNNFTRTLTDFRFGIGPVEPRQTSEKKNPLYCSKGVVEKKHSRFPWLYLSHSFCSCWVNIQIFAISVVRKPRTEGGEIERKSVHACLSAWHSRAKSESNFICLLSGPHVSKPMTYHLVAVILQQWCCDLVLPQSYSPLLTSSCMGLSLCRKKITQTLQTHIFSSFSFSHSCCSLKINK